MAEAASAICVQRFDDSRNSAIHTTYRISLRSSSLREPRYPLLRVVLVMMHRQGRCIITLVWFGLVFVGLDRPTCFPREGKPGPTNPTSECGKGRLEPESPRGQTQRVHVCVLIDSMILPQVHLRKPCYDFSFL